MRVVLFTCSFEGITSTALIALLAAKKVGRGEDELSVARVEMEVGNAGRAQGLG